MTALVLAGGGVTGIAWETGVLLGLEQTGRLPLPDLVVGTSAGSVVGAQLLSGTPLQSLYDRQVAETHGELVPAVDLEELVRFFMSVGDISGGVPPEVAVEVGAFARGAQTVPIERRRTVIEGRLPSHEWPATPFLVTTADSMTGELVVLDSGSGVSLVDAVMASCAVPGVWPPVPLLGRVLIDGGVLSMTHQALAAGHDEVLVLVPMAGPVLRMVDHEAVLLREDGATVTVMSADQETVDAMGPNALDPAMRRPAAEAGLRQGLAV